jgi:hypothetical protein
VLTFDELWTKLHDGGHRIHSGQGAGRRRDGDRIPAAVNDLSFATLLTVAGAGIAAGLVTSLVEVLKTAWGREDMPVPGAALAFGLSPVLYLLAGIATGVASLETVWSCSSPSSPARRLPSVSARP